jgi:hypothetical protein
MVFINALLPSKMHSQILVTDRRFVIFRHDEELRVCHSLWPISHH